jgi:hypothetical protein
MEPPLVNEPEDRKEISSSKTKCLWGFLVSMAFVALGCWLIFQHLGIITIIVVLAITFFFGICAICFLFAFFDNKIRLIINTKGLFYNSSVVAWEVLWSDVDHMAVITISGQKMILLFVHNPDEYINRQKTALRRFFMRQSLTMCGTPLSIASNGL